jgi:hypothetical protein
LLVSCANARNRRPKKHVRCQRGSTLLQQLHHPLLRHDQSIEPRRFTVEVVGDSPLYGKRRKEYIDRAQLVAADAFARSTTRNRQ